MNSQNLKIGTDLWKADREIVTVIDHALLFAIARGQISADEYGILETEENDFYKRVVEIRRGGEITPDQVNSGPFREQFYRECSRIGMPY